MQLPGACPDQGSAPTPVSRSYPPARACFVSWISGTPLNVERPLRSNDPGENGVDGPLIIDRVSHGARDPSRPYSARILQAKAQREPTSVGLVRYHRASGVARVCFPRRPSRRRGLRHCRSSWCRGPICRDHGIPLLSLLSKARRLGSALSAGRAPLRLGRGGHWDSRSG